MMKQRGLQFMGAALLAISIPLAGFGSVSTQAQGFVIDAPVVYGTVSVPPTPGVGPLDELPNGGDEFSGPSFVRHEGGPDAHGVKLEQPDHFVFGLVHFHYVDRITNRYDGFYDKNTGRGCTGPCELGLTEQQSWSNGWSATIGFEKGPVNGTVGYDVEYSSSQSFSYSFPVAAGETRVVIQRDWYHVTNMDVHTEYWDNNGQRLANFDEYGTSFANEWYQRIFRADPA